MGFTLVETLIAATILSMLLVGATEMYLTALKASSRSGAQVSATSRAAVTIGQIVDMSRECYGLAVPTDAGGFAAPVAGTTASDYITSDGSAAALQLTAPGTGAVAVINSLGSVKTAGTDFTLTYAQTAGPTLTVYRSDAAGRPAPNTGQYLWEQGTPPGQPALAAGGRKLAVLAETAVISASTPDAATFVRTPGANASTPAIEVHLIAGDYSASHGSQTNESAASQIVGKCVLLRNHP